MFILNVGQKKTEKRWSGRATAPTHGSETRDVRLRKSRQLFLRRDFHAFQVLHLAEGAVELLPANAELGLFLADALQAAQIPG